MLTPSSIASPRLALFDLDGTLTWHDTLLEFLFGYAVRHPRRWLGLWRLVPAVFSFGVTHGDRGLLKSRVIRVVMGGAPRDAVDSWAERFVGALERRRVFRPRALEVLAGHRAAGDRLVLLSASPDLYVPRIGRLLGFERTLCTEITWQGESPDERLDGALGTPNRRGEEKSRCLAGLRAQYPGLPVVAYGNSASDIAHLLQAEGALLVNGNAKARHAATAVGLGTDAWV